MAHRYDPSRHNRQSIRLKGYDYRQPGGYFITICTQDRRYLFGDVVEGCMRLNDAGRVVQAVWNEIPDHYPGVTVDAFIVMPDHMHGIVVLVGTGPRACPESEPISIHGQARGPAPTLSLPDVVNRYKTMTTKRYTDGVKNQQWAPFPGRLWQRNYYEHIIQNEHALNLIRRYIRNNPAKWAADRLARAAEQTSVR